MKALHFLYESLLYNISNLISHPLSSILTTSLLLIILYVPRPLLPILLSPVPICTSILLYSLRRSGTLADHIGNDRLIDLAHRRPSTSHTPPEPPISISISRQRSCSEFRRLDEERSSRDELEHDHKEDRKIRKKKSSSKENHHRPIGGSMRYIGNKLLFPRSSKPDSPPSSTSYVPPSGRISVDKNALASSRSHKSDFLLDIPSFESECSDVNPNRIPNPRAPCRPNNNIYHHNDVDKNHESKSAEMNPTMKPAPPAIRRKSSGSAAWALSIRRRSRSSPLVDDNARPAVTGLRSFSNLWPPTPGKRKGGGSMGNILSLGLDLFRKKSCSPTTLTPSSSFGNGSPRMAAGEDGHQFKMAHNRLMQWRFVNARSEASRRAKGAIAQSVLIGAWATLSKLQTSVAQKQLQLHKEKLGLKIDTILSYQSVLIGAWAALSKLQTSMAQKQLQLHKEKLGLKINTILSYQVDLQTLSAALGQANDLTSTIKTTVGIFSPMVEKTVPLISELAQVVGEEKSLLEEVCEVLSLISSFQLLEESLKCHLIQLNSVRSREHLQARNAITTA